MELFKTIQVTVEKHIARVMLNRPDVRNAFNPSMISEITEAFRMLSKASEVRVIVLSGAGKSFCSGADLGYMQSMASFTLEQNQQDSQQLFEMFWEIRNCPQPIVARLHGHVMGGALGLTAVCDIAAAVDGTVFCFSEARLGLVPAVISPFVLERMVASRAQRFMLTAEVFSTLDALSSGLVQFIGNESSVDSFIANAVTSLSQNGPEAVRETKKLIRQVLETGDWSQRRELTTRVIAERRVSEEGQEGLRGFLEKRDPSWKGPK
jgi:methylglutaconyl-CoA hydratase